MVGSSASMSVNSLWFGKYLRLNILVTVENSNYKHRIVLDPEVDASLSIEMTPQSGADPFAR